jgi:small subunit ribosomal protein S4
MARCIGPDCRLCRREGVKLYLKGDRCYSKKCAVDKRAYAPGQHGQGRKKVSEYGTQLREKQKLRRIYGVLERQFALYFERAERKQGKTGENLLQILETRLDNTVFRTGLSASRTQARQLVKHGHFMVNGHRVDIPSYIVRVGDVIEVREKSRGVDLFKDLAAAAAQRGVPAWLDVNFEAMKAKVVALPAREQIDVPVQEHMIIELYSR